MATLQEVLNDLHTLKNVVKVTTDSCYATKSRFFQPVVFELNTLSDAISDVRISIYRPVFKTLPKSDDFLAELARTTKRASLQLQDFALGILAEFTRYRRESGRERAAKAIGNSRVEEAGKGFAKSARSLRRVLDVIEGREDWSRMTPKEPPMSPPRSAGSKNNSPRIGTMGPPPRPGGSLNLSAAADIRPSISVPPSPFQPTIEDVDDDPEDEPQHVTNYHLDPKDIIGRPLQGNVESPLTSPPVPQVFVRAPTELTEDMLPSQILNSPNFSTRPLKSAMKKGSNSSGGSSQGNSPRASHDGSPGNKLVPVEGNGSTLEQLQEQVQLLQAELEGLRTSSDNSPRPGSKREHRLSVDFDRRPEFIEPPQHHGRNRASTMSSVGSERPQTLRTGSENYVRRRTPRQSPREPSKDYPSNRRSSRPSPQESTLPYPSSPRMPVSPRMPQEAWQMPEDPARYNVPMYYGQEPRGSLPTLVEGEQQHAQAPRRTPQPSPRFSGTFDQFFAPVAGQGGGDFELFGPPPPDAREQLQRTPMIPREDSWTPVLEHELAVSLEDLYNGTTMKAKISRKIHDPMTNRVTQEENYLHIPISRGLKAGSKIKFPGTGDIMPSGAQDIHFLIREAPHPSWTRQDNDLHTTLEIPLLESLLGWERTISTICGKRLRISNKGPTPPDWRHNVTGFGMVNRKNVDVRGDLVVGVKVVYPTTLSDSQRRLILEALGGRRA